MERYFCKSYNWYWPNNIFKCFFYLCITNTKYLQPMWNKTRKFKRCFDIRLSFEPLMIKGYGYWQKCLRFSFVVPCHMPMFSTNKRRRYTRNVLSHGVIYFNKDPWCWKYVILWYLHDVAFCSLWISWQFGICYGYQSNTSSNENSKFFRRQI